MFYFIQNNKVNKVRKFHDEMYSFWVICQKKDRIWVQTNSRLFYGQKKFKFVRLGDFETTWYCIKSKSNFVNGHDRFFFFWNVWFDLEWSVFYDFIFFLIMCSLEAHFVRDYIEFEFFACALWQNNLWFVCPLFASFHTFSPMHKHKHALSFCRSLVDLVGWLLPKKRRKNLAILVGHCLRRHFHWSHIYLNNAIFTLTLLITKFCKNHLF